MKEKRIKYPIGLQDFASIIEEGNVYVDKTEILFDLIHSYKYVFLSRPRRFGKSLILSTLRYYFEGRKELFEGLKISELEKDWKNYPVLHLSMANFNAGNPKSLSNIFEYQFGVWEEKYEIKETLYDFAQRFQQLIRKAFEITGERVVILIDEYDQALINTLHNAEIHERNRELLKSVYSNLKDMDAYIKFGMLTGVSRFSKTSIFSGLNNITDITFNDNYSTICGFTQEEIRQYLWPGVEDLAKKRKVEPEEALSDLQKYYDGYHFTEEMIDVYNPFSLLNCLSQGKIKDYWFMSGVPTFLIKKIKESKEPFKKIFSAISNENSLQESDTAMRSPVALMYQSGYLTIKDVEENDDFSVKFKLGVPNREVEKGLYSSLLEDLCELEGNNPMYEISDMAICLKEGKPEKFLDLLKSFIAGIPFPIRDGETEQFFQRNMFLILKVIGMHVHAEFETSDGRIDILVETPGYVYVMELKKGDSAEEAMAQIKTKNYALQWKYDARFTFLIGIAFSPKTRNITDWEIEKT